jgi:tRNA-specific 2-thiouridylase
MKFAHLMHRMYELEYDYVVTGHYARVEQDAASGRYLLKKGVDESKDQSYVLYNLTQEQLAHTLFPLGAYRKSRIREIADEMGLVNARKPDSQDICFVPEGDYGSFLEEYTGKHYPPGNFLDENGKILGQHRGAVRYTLGQRKGLGVPAETRMYVTGKDMEKNTVTLGSNSDLFTQELLAGDLCLTEDQKLTAGRQLSAKVRYRQTAQPCRVYPEKDRFRVVFDSPQRAVTPGQAVVLYDGNIVVGGGTIL